MRYHNALDRAERSFAKALRRRHEDGCFVFGPRMGATDAWIAARAVAYGEQASGREWQF